MVRKTCSALKESFRLCLFGGILSFCILGCRSLPYTQWNGKKIALCFLEEKDTCFEEEIMPHTKEAYKEFFPLFDLTNEEIQQIETDVFHCYQFRRVKFMFIDDPLLMSEFFSQECRKQGWLLVRKILLTEYTNSGGDWLEVYQKGPSFVRIHIMGYYRISEDELEKHKPFVPTRHLYIDFIGIPPSLFFETIPSPTKSVMEGLKSSI